MSQAPDETKTFHKPAFFTGAILGAVGGYLDTFTEFPCGSSLALFGSFAFFQVLDFKNVIQLPWNDHTSTKNSSVTSAFDNLKCFAKGNMDPMAGFLAGNMIGNQLDEWITNVFCERDSIKVVKAITLNSTCRRALFHNTKYLV